MKWTHDDFFREQSKGMPPLIQADLTGKTIIITGANVGLGLEAAKHFATMNPERLIVACRNEIKGGEAARGKNASNFNRVEVWTMDQGNFSTVKAFADRAEKELDRIDYLVLNAAVATYQYNATVDGWETQVQVNHLAPTLLALLLLPKMFDTAKRYGTSPRLVSVSTNAHYTVTIDKEVLDAPSSLKMYSSEQYSTPKVMENRYQSSKLVNLVSLRSLHYRLPQTSPTITIVAVSPGFCATSLTRHVPNQATDYWKKMKEVAFTAEEGSRPILYGAFKYAGTEEEERKIRGGYLFKSELMEVSDWVLSEEGKKAEDKFWAETIEILGKVDDRVRKVVSECLVTD
ncbi:hypothetical protein D9758_005246 [Tetrapyrgos nigripes]|uniref:Short-chain dehydrogenase n=1 Tax=Tetrapyrgos nigripes TaxID=182062 RepID=A0A8H5GWP1_9AGAR|nr:hypothetical protein D9758_005246 [Tetrapyrgos nigripes]